jgi:hypothetical protein
MMANLKIQQGAKTLRVLKDSMTPYCGWNWDRCQWLAEMLGRLL